MTRLRVIAVIQARMGSTRLRDKSLRKIGEKTLVERVWDRIRLVKEVDDVVLSTSKLSENDVLVQHAESIGLKYFRGDEADLVSRLHDTAVNFCADALVRITGDCPLADPDLIDEMVKFYRVNTDKYDYLCNIVRRTYPDGLDIEILPTSTLRILKNEISSESEYREGFNLYILDNKDRFKIFGFENKKENLSSLRWTVDFQEDLDFVSEIYKYFDEKNKKFKTKDTLDFLSKNPDLQLINSDRRFNIKRI